MGEVIVKKYYLFGGSPLFLLFLVFLVLKLTRVISWSWWWITSPLWIPLFIVAIILLFAFLSIMSYYLFKRRRRY
jgi:hypothetical protein